MLTTDQIDRIADLANYAISIPGAQTAQALSEAATAETIFDLVEMLRAAQKDAARIMAVREIEVGDGAGYDDAAYVNGWNDALTAMQRDCDGSQHADSSE